MMMDMWGTVDTVVHSISVQWPNRHTMIIVMISMREWIYITPCAKIKLWLQ